MNSITLGRTARHLSIGIGLSLLVVSTSNAAPRSRGADDGTARANYVVAESRWGHGTVSGPVRPGARGWQVRLPGGTWVDCVRNNCSETLRLETVDVFERMQQRDGGPNYFRWERRY